MSSTLASAGSARRASRSAASLTATPMPRRMRSSLLGPNPATPRSLPLRTASASSPTLVTPSSLAIWSARLGPTPGTFASSRAPGGTLARRSSTALIVPVRRYSAIFAAIDEPTPGILVSAGVRDRADVIRVPADRLGGLLVVPRTERVTAGEPEQLRVLPQQRGDFLVDRRHTPIVARLSTRSPTVPVRRGALLAVIPRCVPALLGRSALLAVISHSIPAGEDSGSLATP